MVVQTTFWNESERSQDIEANMISEIYRLYPRKVGRVAAFRAIASALKKIGFKDLLRAVSDYAICVSKWPEKDKVYIPHPSTWFNQERWEDDRSSWNRGVSERNNPKNKSAEREYKYDFIVKTL